MLRRSCRIFAILRHVSQSASRPARLRSRADGGAIAVPEDYEETLAYYTKHGYRVIALAGKSMPGLTWIKAQRLKR